jgi:hypothetical protein
MAQWTGAGGAALRQARELLPHPIWPIATSPGRSTRLLASHPTARCSHSVPCHPSCSPNRPITAIILKTEKRLTHNMNLALRTWVHLVFVSNSARVLGRSPRTFATAVFPSHLCTDCKRRTFTRMMRFSSTMICASNLYLVHVYKTKQLS